jgi:hypothetical protein
VNVIINENSISVVLVQRTSKLMEMTGKAAYKIKTGLKRDCLYKDTAAMFFLCYVFIELYTQIQNKRGSSIKGSVTVIRC